MCAEGAMLLEGNGISKIYLVNSVLCKSKTRGQKRPAQLGVLRRPSFAAGQEE